MRVLGNTKPKRTYFPWRLGNLPGELVERIRKARQIDKQMLASSINYLNSRGINTLKIARAAGCQPWAVFSWRRQEHYPGRTQALAVIELAKMILEKEKAQIKEKEAKEGNNVS